MSKLLALLLLLPPLLLGQGTTPTFQVKTVASLMNTPVPFVNNRLTALVSGRLTTNDGYGGTFYYDPLSTATTNTGTVFEAPTGAGRWIRQFQPPFNLGWFGAVGDNSTDNNTALSSAISTASGKELFIPSGTYRVVASSGNIFTINSDLTISGENGAIISFPTTATATEIHFNVAATRTVTFRNLQIAGAASSGGFDIIGIKHSGTSGGLTLDNVRISSVDTGVKLEEGACLVDIRNSVFTDCRSQGYLVDTGVGTASEHSIINSRFFNIGTTTLHHGLYIEAPFRNINVSSCTFSNITGSGIHRVGGVAGSSGSFRLSNSQFLSCGAGGGVNVQQDSNSFTTSIDNCGFFTTLGLNLQTQSSVNNCTFGSGNGITVQGSTATDGAITSCTFTNNGHGIYLSDSGAVGWTISGNGFMITSGDHAIRAVGASSVSIVGNRIKTTGGNGIDISGTGATKFVISGNIFSGGGSAIYPRSTASDPIIMIVQGNNFNDSNSPGTVEVAGVRWFNNSGVPTASAGKALIVDHSGNTSPEAVLTAGIGSIFRRLDGGAGTIVYQKESGTGNTGWIAVSSASSVAPISSPFVTAAADATLTSERTLTGTASQITVTDGGANSTITLSVPSSLSVATGYRIGGAAASGNFLRGNGTDFIANTIQSGDVPSSVTAGVFIMQANDANFSAERALTGTANQVVLTDGGANSTMTLSLPQSIHTAATPTFSDLTLSALTNTRIVSTGTGGTVDDNATLGATLTTGASLVTLTADTSQQVGIGGVSNGGAVAVLDVLVNSASKDTLFLHTSAGVTQISDLFRQRRVATTDATVTTLQTIAITAGNTYLLDANVRARRTAGAAGTADDGAVYIRRAMVTTKAGTVTINAVQDGLMQEDQAAWDCTFTVSGTDVLLRVTGAVNNNIEWHSLVQVSYVSGL